MMRNIQTREGFEFWDKLNALPRYAFLLSPSGNSVQKFEDQAMGNWIDVHEAQKIVDQAQERISDLRDELGAAKGEYDRAANKIDALQMLLNSVDQRRDELESLLEQVLENTNRALPASLLQSIRGKLPARAPCPPANEAEREPFEAWHRSRFATRHSTGQPTRDMHNGILDPEYGPPAQQQMWEAWQARAALSLNEASLAESRTITLSGCEFTEDELVGKAVRAVTGHSRRGTLRWVAMKDAFCVGSGVAHALCRRFGYDPDETVKP